MNKKAGPILAVIVFIIILIGGYFLGKYIAREYNKNHNTNMNIFKILKIETEDKPINYVLKDGPKSIKELCGKDTGICDKEAGRIILNNIESKLYIYNNFDNPTDEAINYFKLNNTKIGSFIYLDEFAIFNNYLLVTEPNSLNNNYLIHIYDNNGKEITNYTATNIVNNYEIKDNILYFYYCDPADTKEIDGNILPKVSYYKVISDNIKEKNEESFEYKACS
ncbi:MAG: hypothetical protein PHX19_03195 [Bacilli bacterium]|nr:hypothetical protein [Bacilli bacterium]MDD4408036.1 hypothetical protein [Bacilli bacterium]